MDAEAIPHHARTGPASTTHGGTLEPAAPFQLATASVYLGLALVYGVLVTLETLASWPEASLQSAVLDWVIWVCASAAGWTALAEMHARLPAAWRPLGFPALVAMALAHLTGGALALEAARLLTVWTMHGLPGGPSAAFAGLLSRLLLVAVYLTLPALALAAWRLRARRGARWQQRLASAEAEQRSARQELMESELLALQAQVEPHFLFNTLAHIRWHYRSDPRRAGSMLELLVHFALDLLPAARSAGIPMHVELALVQRYLELLALRMGERLRWTVEVPEALRQALVPSMGLLTLVENAVQHGIGRLGRGGTVQLRASVQPDNLQVEVLDDGVGLRSGAGANVGLSNLRAKLLLMAGETARFELRNRAEGGVRAVITLPLRQGLHPETRSKAAPGADTSSARPRLPWRLVLAGAVAVWAWQLLEAHLGADPTGAAMPRALLEVPLAAACMLGLAVLARRAAHGGLQAVLLVGGALLAGSALGIGLSHLLLGGAGPDAPSLQSLRCAAPGDCARGTKDALTVALQAALFGALFAWAARLQMGHAQTQQRALTLAAHSAELRRHAAAARLRAARARAEPADVARLLQRLHERYRASPLDGETMLDALTAYLRSVAETAHSPRVSLQREIHGLRAFAALERAAQDVEPGELLRVELDDGVDLAVTVAPLSLLQPLRLLWAATPAARLSLRLRRGPPGRLHARIACALPRPAVMPGVEGDTLVAALTPLSAHAVRQPDGSLHWTLDVETC